eukprot:238419_1
MSIVVLRDIKRIHEISRNVVFGYIRNSQRSFKWQTHNPYYNVPLIISHWCLLYVFYRPEYIDKYMSGDIKINDQRTIAEAICSKTTNYVFGGMPVNNFSNVRIYFWEFKIAKPYHGFMKIGIIESTTDTQQHGHLKYLCDGKGKRIEESIHSVTKCYPNNGCFYMELDTKTKLCLISATTWNTKYHNIQLKKDTQYVLIIKLPREGSSVEIVNSKQIFFRS